MRVNEKTHQKNDLGGTERQEKIRHDEGIDERRENEPLQVRYEVYLHLVLEQVDYRYEKGFDN